MCSKQTLPANSWILLLNSYYFFKSENSTTHLTLTDHNTISSNATITNVNIFFMLFQPNFLLLAITRT
jgi:hypothetical protein